MTILDNLEGSSARFWIPWLGALVVAAIYGRSASSGDWQGYAAIILELIFTLRLRHRLIHRRNSELEFLRTFHWPGVDLGDADQVIAGASERIQLDYGSASSAVLALGMACTALLLLLNGGGGAVEVGFLSVAPKAFGSTGYAILCALSLAYDGYVSGVSEIPEVRRIVLRGIAAQPSAEGDRDDIADANQTVGALALGQIAERMELLVHAQTASVAGFARTNDLLQETGRLLILSATDQDDERTGQDRVKLAKGLRDFRDSIGELRECVDAMSAHLRALSSEESALLKEHSAAVLESASKIPEQVFMRLRDEVRSQMEMLHSDYRRSIESIHADEARHARDLLATEFRGLTSELERTQPSVAAIAVTFNNVVQSLESLAGAFGRTAEKVTERADQFTKDSAQLMAALGELGAPGAVGTSLLGTLALTASEVRKIAEKVSEDLRSVKDERGRLADIRGRIAALVPRVGS